MRISCDWLKDYITTSLSPEKLAELLTMAGLSVESVTRLGGDSILEIEITANRPDWLSYIGVAREVAALTGGKLKIPYIKSSRVREFASSRVSGNEPANSRTREPIVRVEDESLCPRYTARVIRGVKIADSPAWLKNRIEAMDLRPVNNVVDITNFCLFETGEPMHAFDLDRISGARIVVRKARAGERIRVIDGSEKALDQTMLVIADAERPVAVAGIMGGSGAEVTYSTHDILLEAACFDPVSIRRTSRKLGLSSESSYRFERKVDRENVPYASDRALGLIMEIAGGRPEEFIDIETAPVKAAKIMLSCGRLNSLLGTDISPAKIRKVASGLGMKVTGSGAQTLKIQAPSFRQDIKGEVDVIEEIARVNGYDKIPSTLPRIVEQPVRVEPAMARRDLIRDALAALGVDEIMTYSLIDRKTATALEDTQDGMVEVKNPLTSEQEVMRPSLIPGMLGAIAWNINRKSRDLRFYELGNVYSMKGGPDPREELRLSIGISGSAFSSWAGGSRESGFFELKGMAEALLRELGIDGAAFEETSHPDFAASQCASIMLDGARIGLMGQVSRKALDIFDIKEKVYVLEADAGAIVDRARTERRFMGLTKFPSITRDISILVPSGTRNSDVISVISNSAGPILKSAELVDMYKGKQIPPDKISLTYRLEYQDPARTLEDKDISAVHASILKALDERLGAKLR